MGKKLMTVTGNRDGRDQKERQIGWAENFTDDNLDCSVRSFAPIK
jgi:hypothetical protein